MTQRRLRYGRDRCRGMETPRVTSEIAESSAEGILRVHAVVCNALPEFSDNIAPRVLATAVRDSRYFS